LRFGCTRHEDDRQQNERTTQLSHISTPNETLRFHSNDAHSTVAKELFDHLVGADQQYWRHFQSD